MSLIPRDERTRWVGASEVAALFGCHPQLTLYKLWHIKMGNIDADDLDGVERVEAGQFMEPSIAAWAAHKWDWPLRKVNDYSVHPSVPGMGASLDFETWDRHEPTEIKNVDRSIFYDPAKGWAIEGQELVDAPIYFLIQVQHQLACKPGIPQGWIVPCVGGNRLFRMPIERHPNMIAKIEQRVDWFWGTITRGEEPAPNFEKDSATISKLYKGLGLEAIDLTNSTSARALCIQYSMNHEAETAAKKVKQACLAELKFMMQDAQAADIEGFKIKASHIKGGTTVRQPCWRFNITKEK
jgi:predicted phage-related endonuclease